MLECFSLKGRIDYVIVFQSYRVYKIVWECSCHTGCIDCVIVFQSYRVYRLCDSVPVLQSV